MCSNNFYVINFIFSFVFLCKQICYGCKFNCLIFIKFILSMSFSFGFYCFVHFKIKLLNTCIHTIIFFLRMGRMFRSNNVFKDSAPHL